jgi:hypothetical protein
MLGSVFDSGKEFFGNQCYSLHLLVLIVSKLGRTLSIAPFGLNFGNLHAKFYRTKLGFLYTYKLYFNPILLVLLVL